MEIQEIEQQLTLIATIHEIKYERYCTLGVKDVLGFSKIVLAPKGEINHQHLLGGQGYLPGIRTLRPEEREEEEGGGGGRPMEECVGQSFPASMADYMCTSWVSTFSSKSTFSKHKARHLEFRRKVTEEEEWALAIMIREEHLLFPCL